LAKTLPPVARVGGETFVRDSNLSTTRRDSKGIARRLGSDPIHSQRVGRVSAGTVSIEFQPNVLAHALGHAAQSKFSEKDFDTVFRLHCQIAEFQRRILKEQNMKINPTARWPSAPANGSPLPFTSVNTPYQVGEPGNPYGGAWISKTGPNPRFMIFDAPMNGVCGIVLSYRFLPDATGAIPNGAQYNTAITGNPAEDTFRQTITAPPNDQAISYDFIVARAVAGGGAGII
jgi:hypothetical protein